MKHILIPTDFSDNAKNAIRYAIALYGNTGSDFILLNTYKEGTFSSGGFEDASIQIAGTEHALKKEAEWVKTLSEARPLNIKTISQKGETSDVLDSMALGKKADMIIMGTKGATGVTDVYAGSTTTSVIEKVILPLIAVPEKAHHQLPRSIVLAADLRKITDGEVLRPIVELAVQFNSSMKIINVLDQGKTTNTDEMQEALKLHQLLGSVNHSYHFIENEDKAQGIENFIKNEQSSMLAVVARRSSFFDSIFHRSTTHKLALYTDIPLFVLHDLK